MKFGIHLSIAGGLDKAVGRATETGCECFQIFSRSPHGGARKQIVAVEVEKFKETWRKNGELPFYIHTPYYINFASSQPRVFHGSVEAVRTEMETAERLGAQAVVTHLGSAKDLGREAGKRKIVEGICAVFAEKAAGDKTTYRQFTSKLLLEITAGSGEIMGDTFEEMAYFLQAAEAVLGKGVLGVCFDTAHAFGSGYDLSSAESARRTFDQFDEVVGLDRIQLIHFNDSLVPLASHKDRHANWGEGLIGWSGAKAILQDPRLKDLDFVLETPPPQNLTDLTELKKMRDGK